MDPATLMTAVHVLGEVFKGTASAAGTEVFNYIKRWFQGKPQADHVLEQAKQNPEAFLPAVQFYIKELADDSAEFRKGLQALLDEVTPPSSTGRQMISVAQSKNVGVAMGQSSVSLNVTESAGDQPKSNDA